MRFLMFCVLSLLALPSLVFADAPRSFAELAEMIVGLLNSATAVIMTLGVVLYFWGLSTNINSFQEDGQKRKAYFIWGIVILFVMVSIWGLVALIQNTLFGT